MPIGTEIAKDILKKRIVDDISKICADWGVSEINIMFETLSTLFVTITNSFSAEVIKSLEKYGYNVNKLIPAKNNKIILYTVVKKQF